MADSRLHEAWSVLVAEGRVSDSPPEPLGSGNVDRRADDEKCLYRVTLKDGIPGKLTIGKDLTDLAARSRAWAKTFPSLACAPVAHLEGTGWSALLESYFAGISLENAVANKALPMSRVHRAFSRIRSILESTRSDSTEAKRAAEWENWSRSIGSLPLWDSGQTVFLQHQLLPALASQLLQGSPQTQWVHGDLIDRNVLLDPSGAPCLIDPEFAQLTHFFPAEVSRFYALSSAARDQPGIFADTWPKPPASWELFFWLEQVLRESRNNTEAYMAKWLPHRLAMIRHLAATVLEGQLNWPWPAADAAASETSETAKLIPFGLGHWQEDHLMRLSFGRDRPQTLFFRLNGVSGPFRLSPSEATRPVTMKRLASYSSDGSTLHETSRSQLHALSISGLGDSVIKYVPDGIVVTAPLGDPQVVLPEEVFPPGAQWLEVELAIGDATAIFPTHLFRIEERRWADQPSPTAARITGWCVSPDDSEWVRVEARVNGTVVASSAPQPRPDVQQHLLGKTHALHSGFVLEIASLQTFDFIELLAVSVSGQHFLFDVIQAGDLSNRTAILNRYPAWAKRNDPDPPPPRRAPSFATRFSILLPVFDPPLPFLDACLSSVRSQHFAQWELCVVDDASTHAQVVSALEQAAHADARIRVQRRSVNGGISQATNDALAIATGDYVVFLDHDDLLRPHALLELARELNDRALLDVIYSDEDKISAEGQRLIPFLKPSFSPEYLLGVMYPGHVLCVRRTLAQSIGGFDSAFDGIQDYEFFLRLTEHTQHIGHLGRILYHWRQSPTSSALDGNIKGDMDQKQILAVRAHLRRRKDQRLVTSLGRHRLKLQSENNPRRRTAILLAWEAGLAQSSTCDWNGLFAEAGDIYAGPSVSLPSTDRAIHLLPDSNWTNALPRLAASKAADVFIIFTAPPTALPEGWCEALAQLSERPDAGCIAPLLLSREGVVFEAGRTYSKAGSHPVMCGFRADADGYNGSLVCDREVSTVSALCVAVRADLIAANTPTNLQDWSAFCEGLRTRGLFNRVCPQVRIQIPLSWRQAVHLRRPASGSEIDPYFNAHFDPVAADYTLVAAPESQGGSPVPFLWHLDLAPGPRLSDGCLTLRGWCFRVNGSPVTVNVEIAGISWSATCDQPRPDVAARFEDSGIASCGFKVHLRLPSGDHLLAINAVGNDGEFQPMYHGRLFVPATAALRRWLRPQVGHRATFQLMAAPSTRACPIELETFPRPTTDTARWPRFVIVTPSFQHGRFLGETMRSVLTQPEVRCDYVVQDGGSTDGSVALIEKEAPHLAAWESVSDAGQADAIERGFRKVAGSVDDVMAWLNSDDFYLPGTLAFVADYFTRHPDVDVVYGHRVIVDGASREVGRWFLPAHDVEMLRVNDYVPQETLFWRRRIWDKAGRINPSLKFAMDWDLLLRFQMAGAKIVRVPYFLACFRIHSSQKTSSQMESIGQKEIDALRERTFGRAPTPAEIETNPYLIRYLRKSAWIEFLWRRFQIRHP